MVVFKARTELAVTTECDSKSLGLDLGKQIRNGLPVHGSVLLHGPTELSQRQCAAAIRIKSFEEVTQFLDLRWRERESNHLLSQQTAGHVRATRAHSRLGGRGVHRDGEGISSVPLASARHLHSCLLQFLHVGVVHHGLDHIGSDHLR